MYQELFKPIIGVLPRSVSISTNFDQANLTKFISKAYLDLGSALNKMGIQNFKSNEIEKSIENFKDAFKLWKKSHQINRLINVISSLFMGI